jgi:hypothetical protein
MVSWQNKTDFIFQPATGNEKTTTAKQKLARQEDKDGQSRRSLKRRYKKKTRQTFPTMDPAHYETQLNIHFEYVEGYIKALKKKNITDEEREKVKKSLCFCASYKLFPSKEKEKRTTIQLTDVFFLCSIHTLLSRLALFFLLLFHILLL